MLRDSALASSLPRAAWRKTADAGKPQPSLCQPWSHNRGRDVRSPGHLCWPLSRTPTLPLKESIALSSPRPVLQGARCVPIRTEVGGRVLALGRPWGLRLCPELLHRTGKAFGVCAQQAYHCFCFSDWLSFTVPGSSSLSGHIPLWGPPNRKLSAF